MDARGFWKLLWSRTIYTLFGRSEGFPLAAYLIPGRDGMGVWPDSKIVPSDAASMTNTSKTHESSKNKTSPLGLRKMIRI